jgi:hypothetical protein
VEPWILDAENIEKHRGNGKPYCPWERM